MDVKKIFWSVFLGIFISPHCEFPSPEKTPLEYTLCERLERRVFLGDEINVDVKDGDLGNVLRLLGQEGGYQVISSDSVQGEVTLSAMLTPWDLLFGMVLEEAHLELVCVDRQVFVHAGGLCQ